MPRTRAHRWLRARCCAAGRLHLMPAVARRTAGARSSAVGRRSAGRFDQIIDRARLERGQRVFVVGGAEDHRGRRLESRRCAAPPPGRPSPACGYRAGPDPAPASPLLRPPRGRCWPHRQFRRFHIRAAAYRQALAGERFIVNDQDFHRAALSGYCHGNHRRRQSKPASTVRRAEPKWYSIRARVLPSAMPWPPAYAHVRQADWVVDDDFDTPVSCAGHRWLLCRRPPAGWMP